MFYCFKIMGLSKLIFFFEIMKSLDYLGCAGRAFSLELTVN